MRNFRKAALAGATAVAVAFGSTAVATAEPTTPVKPAETTTVAPTRPIDKAVDSNDQEPGLSSKIADWEFLEFKKDGELTGANGGAIFGTGENNDLGSQPAWAKAAFALSIFTSVSAVVGLIVGPLYNYLVHGPVNF